MGRGLRRVALRWWSPRLRRLLQLEPLLGRARRIASGRERRAARRPGLGRVASWRLRWVRAAGLWSLRLPKLLLLLLLLPLRLLRLLLWVARLALWRVVVAPTRGWCTAPQKRCALLLVVLTWVRHCQQRLLRCDTGNRSPTVMWGTPKASALTVNRCVPQARLLPRKTSHPSYC